MFNSNSEARLITCDKAHHRLSHELTRCFLGSSQDVIHFLFFTINYINIHSDAVAASYNIIKHSEWSNFLLVNVDIANLANHNYTRLSLTMRVSNIVFTAPGIF